MCHCEGEGSGAPGQGETATFIPSYITSHPDKVHRALWQHTNSPDVHKLPSPYLHICSPAQWQSFGTKVKIIPGHRSETPSQQADIYGCFHTRRYYSVGGDMCRVGLKSARTQEGETSCAICLCLLQFRASLHSSRAHPCTTESFYCYACCLTLEAPTSTIWTSFLLQHQPCTAMFWFTSEGLSPCLGTVHACQAAAAPTSYP